ncbi:MAG TPA: type II secretion system minor pseudopilin GspI [Spongiibacteraceae bacterium]|nr:type II secretion system minor pseudopilin GspI [Spongiibacteraceae bacterium]
MRRRSNLFHHSGFTLLEVLIALAILALSAAAVLRQTHLEVRQQQNLELKSYALWVADDVLTMVMAQAQWPPLGHVDQEQTYEGQNWRVTTDVQATPDPLLRKIEVSVAPAELGDGSAALITLTAYRGQY